MGINEWAAFPLFLSFIMEKFAEIECFTKIPPPHAPDFGDLFEKVHF